MGEEKDSTSNYVKTLNDELAGDPNEFREWKAKITRDQFPPYRPPDIRIGDYLDVNTVDTSVLL